MHLGIVGIVEGSPVERLLSQSNVASELQLVAVGNTAVDLVDTAAGRGAGREVVDVTLLAGQSSASADPPETANVMDQGGVTVLASDRARLVRQTDGVGAAVTMPAPTSGTYLHPDGTEPGHPEVFTLWMFVFNFPENCSRPCDFDDTMDPDVQFGVYNVAGHVNAGSVVNGEKVRSLNRDPVPPVPSVPLSTSPLSGNGHRGVSRSHHPTGATPPAHRAKAKNRPVPADPDRMGQETAGDVIRDISSPDGSAPAFGGPAPPLSQSVAQRVLSRTESLLRVVDRRAHLLLDRNLTMDETAEIVAAGEAMATIFGRIGHPDLARLARDLIEIFAGEGPWDPTTGIRVAATCEDLRALLGSAIAQYEATADRGGLVVVVGAPSEEVDALCWVTHTRGYAVVHADDGIPGTDRDPVAVVVAVGQNFDPAVKTLLKAVTERWASPLVVLHRGADPATFRCLARYASTILRLDAPPGEIVDELNRVVAADRLEPVALLCGNVPTPAEQTLAAHGYTVTRIDDPDRLPEAFGTTPGVAVLGPAIERSTALDTARLLRAELAVRHNPIVWITDRLDDQDLPARLDVTVVDELGDILAARIGAQLRRRAGEVSEVGSVGNRILEWAAAEVLIDRTLVAAHRTGRQIALATIELSTGLNGERIAALEETLTNEFRLDDTLGRWGERTLVLALAGVSRSVAARRLSSLLAKLDLDDGAARAGVALFPSDGRAAGDLVQSARRAASRSAEHGGPAVVPTTWRPVSDDVDVMVVDADPVLGQMMVDLLERSGLRARLCHNGPEALSALRADDQRITPRLLLLDLDVQGIDGLGMLRELRIAGLLSQIKVLLMMARFSESDLRVALDIGVADVISKPLSTTLLLHRVRLLLGEEP